jgi:6-phosphogluconolactonase
MKTVMKVKCLVYTGRFSKFSEFDGADPCYIINDEKNVIVANYSGGNIAVLEK